MGDYVRRAFNEEETLSSEIKPFREAFIGEIIGILLRNRGIGDPHIIFELVNEDDGFWSPNNISSGSYSSSWFEDYIEVFTDTMNWCRENCDPDIYNGIQFGWKFRD